VWPAGEKLCFDGEGKERFCRAAEQIVRRRNYFPVQQNSHAQPGGRVAHRQNQQSGPEQAVHQEIGGFLHLLVGQHADQGDGKGHDHHEHGDLSFDATSQTPSQKADPQDQHPTKKDQELEMHDLGL
jgi:hypothetical protein